MRLSFNIAGPCIPGEHYMLPPERRLDLRKTHSWADKLFMRDVEHGGKTIRLVGC